MNAPWAALAGRAFSGAAGIFVAKLATAAAAGHLTVRLGNALIDRLAPAPGRAGAGGRGRTLRGVSKSLLRFVVDALVVLVMLDMLGIETRTLLAGAGVVGIVVGLGAQNLFRDLVAGFVVLYDDQFNIGDHIATAGVEGTVEEMGLTTVKVRDFDGGLHFVRYSTIDRVTNYCRGAVRVRVDVPVDCRESPERVIGALARACGRVGTRLGETDPGASVLGVSEIKGNRAVYTVVAKAEPGTQWVLEREIRKAVVESLQESNIRFPEVCVRPVGDEVEDGESPGRVGGSGGP
ncbi:MAG: mechanosensitive ion channel family protein [Firmicutes bacterium]|jgi:small conductance mechanosensitive channel|nr:mechanosensitive ion channel family protein [Bacillota bacterium]